MEGDGKRLNGQRVSNLKQGHQLINSTIGSNRSLVRSRKCYCISYKYFYWKYLLNDFDSWNLEIFDIWATDSLKNQLTVKMYLKNQFKVVSDGNRKNLIMKFYLDFSFILQKIQILA